MNKGILYAVSAAILNAFVGIFSLGAFDSGISASGVAFYKSLLAFLILSIWVMLIPSQRKACVQLSHHASKIALLAFCGIFILYFFETKAYQYGSISLVTFTLLGSATLTTFLGSHFLLNKSQSLASWISMFLAVAGLVVFHSAGIGSEIHFNLGFMLALIAGVGYGLFMVLSKRNPANFHGIAMLWWLLLFGSLFLFIPYMMHTPEIPSLHACLYIALLGGASTIGGFYCTTKALSLASATTVQLFELNEPLFASILAFIFYKQSVTTTDALGGLLIILAIYIAGKSASKKTTKQQTSSKKLIIKGSVT